MKKYLTTFLIICTIILSFANISFAEQNCKEVCKVYDCNKILHYKGILKCAEINLSCIQKCETNNNLEKLIKIVEKLLEEKGK